MKQRNSSLDNISGLLIIYMILWHICQWCNLSYLFDNVFLQMLSFFMFWFFFKSGIFYHERTSKKIIMGGGKKLLIPFVIFSILGHLLECVHWIVLDDFSLEKLILLPVKSILLSGSCNGNLPLWFLPTLLAVQILYNLLHRKIRDECICLLGFIVVYTIYLMGWHRPLYVGNIALGLLAYAMGHLMREKQYKNAILLISLVTYSITLAIQSSFIDFRMNDLASGYYPLAIVFGLSGCVLINNLFQRLSLRIGFLEYIGTRSMAFYVLHWLIICTCYWTLNLSSWPLLGVMIASCIIVLPLTDKVISILGQEWLFGIKRK